MIIGISALPFQHCSATKMTKMLQIFYMLRGHNS